MSTQTLFDALVSSLRSAGVYNGSDQAPPVAVLWPDGGKEWEHLIPALHRELPILTVGDYDPETLTGPAIWIRCIVARTLAAPWPEGTIPIIYIPGVSCPALRTPAECPPLLQPLIELQYRGVVWKHRNGKDWTIAGFLLSEAVRVDVSGDAETRSALRDALLELAKQPVPDLREDAPLTAQKCRDLLHPDMAASLLQWLNDPETYRGRQDAAAWGAFRATCRDKLGFDPEADGPLDAARRLGQGIGAWQPIWNRFKEAPKRYPGVPDLMRRTGPSDLAGMFDEGSHWPQTNEHAEKLVRDKLSTYASLTPAQIRKGLRELETQHGERRSWIWTVLDQAPLACVLPHLLTMADVTAALPAGANPEEMARAYTTGSWRADDAALCALAAVKDAGDVLAVQQVIHALYEPWLRDSAVAFQEAVQHSPLPRVQPEALSPGRCLLFVDGLRYDVGLRLAKELARRSLRVEPGWQFGGLPGVTATAKPAISPAAGCLGPGAELSAAAADGARVTAEILRREMQKLGVTLLQADGPGTPGGSAWTETGDLDAEGHAHGWKLARQIDEHVDEMADRIKSLLDAGWREVRVVTDHGWLLLPDGLPKVELPEHLTEIRKGRCARLSPGASVEHQSVPWQWDDQVRIAMAPGISCYVAGREYEHAGLSLQECVLPVLTVQRTELTGPPVSIADVRWKGLRCQITVANSRPGILVDLRTKAGDASTTLADGGKAVGEEGHVSLAVADDSREGEGAVVVVLGGNGQVVAQAATIVGGE